METGQPIRCAYRLACFCMVETFPKPIFPKETNAKKSFKSRSKPVNERRQLTIAAVYL